MAAMMGFSVPGCHQVVLDTHKNRSFRSCFFCLRNVHVHLVSVEVGIVRVTSAFVRRKVRHGRILALCDMIESLWSEVVG